MKKPLKLLIALLALGVIVAGYLLVNHLVNDTEPADTGDRQLTKYLTFDGDIVSIDYTFDGVRIALTRSEDGSWHKSDDDTFPVSADAADALAAALKSVTVLREIDPADADTALFGLDEAPLSIAATAEDGTTLSYAIGIANTALGGYYARYNQDATIYLIDDTMPPEFMGGLYHIATLDSYPQVSSVNVTQVQLEAGDRSRVLNYLEGGSPDCYTPAYEWFDQTTGEPLRSTGVTVLAGRITGLEIGDCVNHAPNLEALEAYGLVTPEMTCRLQYKLYGTDEDAEPTIEDFTLSIGHATDDGVYVTWSGTSMIFLADAAAIDAIRAGFEEDLAVRDVCAVALDDITAVELTTDNRTVRIERTVKSVETTNDSGETTTTETAVYTIDGLMTDGSSFESMMKTITGLQVEATAEHTWDTPPLLTVRFLRDRDAFGDMTLAFYEYDVNFCRAEFNGRTDMLVSIRTVQSLVEQAAALGQ